MSYTEPTEIDQAHEIAIRARDAVAGWPQWKRDEFELEAARFREMGEVARHQR